MHAENAGDKVGRFAFRDASPSWQAIDGLELGFVRWLEFWVATDRLATVSFYLNAPAPTPLVGWLTRLGRGSETWDGTSRPIHQCILMD